MCRTKAKCLRLAAALTICLSLPATALPVRVATFNLLIGVGSVNGAEYNAVADVLTRIDADIVAFQELTSNDRPNWESWRTSWDTTIRRSASPVRSPVACCWGTTAVSRSRAASTSVRRKTAAQQSGRSHAFHEDPETRYLFDPAGLHEAKPAKIREDMQRYGLSKKKNNDPRFWRTVGVTFLKKWGSDPRNFLADCQWDAPTVLKRLKADTHLYANRKTWDYPFLRGPKIGPLWLRLLRDNVGLDQLRNLDQVPIPVDVHVARATLATGVVRGSHAGSLGDAFVKIRKAWFRSVEELEVDGRPMMPLDVDEALWHLSKYGCTKRDTETGTCPLLDQCEAGEFCVLGKLKIDGSRLEVDT
jgi:hypothetical protein